MRRLLLLVLLTAGGALPAATMADNTVQDNPLAQWTAAYYSYVGQLQSLSYAQASQIMEDCSGKPVPGTGDSYAQCDALVAAMPQIRVRERLEARLWYQESVSNLSRLPSSVLIVKDNTCSRTPPFMAAPEYTECRAVEEATAAALTMEDQALPWWVIVTQHHHVTPPPVIKPQVVIEKQVPITGKNIMVPDRDAVKNLEIR